MRGVGGLVSSTKSGPEGDFSEEEREKILKYKSVCSIKINDNILRSETAVISSLSIVNYAIS